MKLQLTKTASTAIPTRVASSLKEFEKKGTQSINGKDQALTAWFIENVIKYKDMYIPRLELLSRGAQIVSNNTFNPKYINTLFLEQSSIISIVQECDILIDISFVLAKHLQLKQNKKQIEYDSTILAAVANRTEAILRKNQLKLDFILSTEHVSTWIDQKRRLPQSIYIIDPYEKEQIQNQVISIFSYVCKPIFQKKSFEKVYDCLYPMVYWFVLIRDETPEKQNVLMEIARKIDSFLWYKKTSSNLTLIKTFNCILDVLSTKSIVTDSLLPQTLAPLLLKLRNIPFQQLICNWISTQNSRSLPNHIENIFRNSISTGCTNFSFQIIDFFSKYLFKRKNFDTLHHLFNSFIRKEYLSVKLEQQYVKSYLNIVMLYAIGFINRQRLDGFNELDRFALNLSEMVCRRNFTYRDCHKQIILFFRIYENRFQFLTSTCKKLVTQLEITYKTTYPIAILHQEVSNRIFHDYSANYNDNDIYSLQRSHRYIGLCNLGNTCYINSFMHSLFMTKKFKSLVIKAKDEGLVPADHPIFKTLVQLFSELETKAGNLRQEIMPNQFKNHTPEPFKSTWDQHDSGQFGRMYIDSVTTQLKDTPISDKINRLFTHEIVSRIICKGCNQIRNKKQKLFDFILSIDEKVDEVITVSDLLKKYFQGYELDSNNMIFCEKCNKNMPALVCNEPTQLAEHLIATVSIFKYDYNGSSKIIKPLNFQFSLNFKNILPKIVKEDEIYELYAFILHIGAGMERGHYQCFARNLEQNPMLWYKFDDDYVTEQQINQIQDFHFGENETPYILLYSNANKTRKILNNF